MACFNAQYLFSMFWNPPLSFPPFVLSKMTSHCSVNNEACGIFNRGESFSLKNLTNTLRQHKYSLAIGLALLRMCAPSDTQWKILFKHFFFEGTSFIPTKKGFGLFVNQLKRCVIYVNVLLLFERSFQYVSGYLDVYTFPMWNQFLLSSLAQQNNFQFKPERKEGFFSFYCTTMLFSPPLITRCRRYIQKESLTHNIWLKERS